MLYGAQHRGVVAIFYKISKVALVVLKNIFIGLVTIFAASQNPFVKQAVSI